MDIIAEDLNEKLAKFIEDNLYEESGDIYWNWRDSIPAEFKDNKKLKNWMLAILLEKEKEQ